MEWYDEPVPLTEADYEQAKAGFVRKANPVRGVRAVYEHRGIAYELGVSDIDLIVVCDPNLPGDAPARLSLNLEEGQARHIYRGGPVVISTALFQETALNPHWELRRLFGDPLERPVLSADEQTAARLVVAMEQSGHNLMSLSRRLSARRWPVKTTLGLLKAVMHNSRGGQEDGQLPSDVASWWLEADTLRRTWFAQGPERYALLESLTRQAVALAQSTCWRAEEGLRQRGWLTGELDQPAFLLGPNGQVVVFADTRTKGEAFASRLGVREAGGSVVLPTAFYLQFASTVQAVHGGFVQVLRRLAVPPIRRNLVAGFMGIGGAVLSQRAASQQAWFEFLSSHGFRRTGSEGAWWMHLATSRIAPTLRGRLTAGVRAGRDVWNRNRLAAQLARAAYSEVTA